MGILPLVNPIINKRPPQLIHLMDSSKTSPPTGSYITSAPLLLVSSFTFSLNETDPSKPVLITSSAPHDFTIFNFSSEVPLAMTLAP